MADVKEQQETFRCQHGGPGELTVQAKKLFLLSYRHNLEQLHKRIVRAPHEMLLASEIALLDEVINSNATMKEMVDMDLVKLYFGMATTLLIKTQVQQAKIHARAGVILASYLKHGEEFWEMTKEPVETQQQTLRDMYLGLGKAYYDHSLAELLNVQTPCNCLELALPALKAKK